MSGAAPSSLPVGAAGRGEGAVSAEGCWSFCLFSTRLRLASSLSSSNFFPWLRSFPFLLLFSSLDRLRSLPPLLLFDLQPYLSASLARPFLRSWRWSRNQCSLCRSESIAL